MSIEEQLAGAILDEEEAEVVIGDKDAASAALVADLRSVRVLRTEKEELEGKLSQINKALADLNPRILRQLDALGITNIKADGVGTAYIFDMAVPKVVDPDKLVGWLDSNGEGGIARRTIHHQTLGAWYRERLENGQGVPPKDLIDVYNVREVRFRKK